MCFGMPLDKGARVIWARPDGRCPVSFIEIYPKSLSQDTIVAISQRTCKPNAKRKFTFRLC